MLIFKVYTAEISALMQLQSQLMQLIGHMHADNNQAYFDTLSNLRYALQQPNFEVTVCHS